ncbi:Sphingosine N-acyltransferase-like protein FUM17 [Colletotrichum orbiculare MAFF 240422]|uniref:Sphingosine N-acyltransferase-like protein FUM17 n=2 Tax=Colletotrichum orbiculare species complex TaxID=2707354 RepID=N4UTX3_COLOR|nr:Sphingosine N-acyltransferase-like protein FUM17 [Colletotrichum orbiculare MAFF 240422]TDZ29884.1 Sphingosine N-acyltransferase-like protein FUM17 [Colletotrichum spinosum]
MADSEPFPLLNTSVDQLHSAVEHSSNPPRTRRRKSSALGQDIRAGDTGPALASYTAGDSPTSPTAPTKRFSKRRRARGVLSRFRQTMIRHTYLVPAIIIFVFAALYAVNPSPSNPVHRFIFLSYRLPPDPAIPDAPAQYGKGLWDIAFVSFYTIVLTFTREFIMQKLLRPLARAAGLRSRGKQARFMEQMYTAIYFACLGPAGMYVMSRTPVWYFSTRGMYEAFPHMTHDAGFKFYYLFQAAYWAQQALVLLLGLEKPRKDFKELVGHHIVSLALIALSYRFHFTYMGLAVYTTHDISDFFLATSKVLNYIDSPIVAPYFFFFVCVWIYLRHFINLKIIISLFTEYTTVGPFELNWATQQYKCTLSQYITLGLLASLQALNLFWLFHIFRIAYRFLAHNIAEDDRSEAEGTDAEDETPKTLSDQKTNGHATGVSSSAAQARAVNGSAR